MYFLKKLKNYLEEKNIFPRILLKIKKILKELENQKL